LTIYQPSRRDRRNRILDEFFARERPVAGSRNELAIFAKNGTFHAQEWRNSAIDRLPRHAILDAEMIADPLAAGPLYRRFEKNGT
jgi:hypothetical protein